MMSRFCRYVEKIFHIGEQVRGLRDSRVRPQIPTSAIWTSVLALFVTGRRSLNAVDSDLKRPNRLDGVVGARKPSGDRIGEVYELMPPDQQRGILARVNHKLGRNKALRNEWPMRFLALDGHELFSSRKRYCSGCAERTIELKDGEITEFYHRCVAYHLIGFDMPVPLDVELTQPGEDEVGTAKRGLKRVAAEYRRFFDAVVGDALYLEAPFINSCLDQGKDVVVILKGDHRLLLQDAEGLFSSLQPEIWHGPRKQIRVWDAEGFTSCEGVKKPLRVLHAEETTTKRERIKGEWVEKTEVKNFWFATTIPASRLSTKALWEVGHARWDIEDDLFNVLVTHWGMNHCFRHHPAAIENFLLTLFIAFVLFECFFLRNLKPAVRTRFTQIAIRDELHAEVVRGRPGAPWARAP